jgi:diacylglycerol kinase (ATP)
MKRKLLSLTRLIRSFGYAINGISVFFAREQNARIHFAVFACVVAAGFFFRLSAMEWMAVALASGSVLTAEAINTSIEELSDAVSPERNPKIKLVKDLAAGAVLISALAAVAVGLLLFVPKIMAWF